MKNVFFALAFMIIGTFAFANSSTVEIIEDKTYTIEFNEDGQCTVSNGEYSVTADTCAEAALTIKLLESL